MVGSQTFVRLSRGPHRSARLLDDGLRWRCDGLAPLPERDVRRLAAVLADHAAASAVERRERAAAILLDRPWSQVIVEADGERIDDPAALFAARSLRLRTQGRSASIDLAGGACIVALDDDPELARLTLRHIETIVRPHRHRMQALAASSWAGPLAVFLLPLIASALDAPGPPGWLTWAGMAASIAFLVAWLWRSHAVRSSAPLLNGTPAQSRYRTSSTFDQPLIARDSGVPRQ